MNHMCGYFAANLRVALNLQADRDAREAAEAEDAQWDALAARAAAIGCKLQRCHLDPDCNGKECGCGPGLRDREDNPVGDLASDEPSQDLGTFTLLVQQLEANGGLRP